MNPDQHPTSGESYSIPDRIVVSPCWGRLEPMPLAGGEHVDAGSIIGHLLEGESHTPLISHARAIFVSWFVDRGERVAPGARIAVLRVSEEG